MTASATVGGIQQLDNDNLDMGTNDFTLEFDELLPTTRPAAAIVLDRKHNGTNGYILSLLTTGIVRLQINGFNFDSTVALASATNVNPKLQVPVIRETATVAGSVTFYSNGVILGVAVAITAHGVLTTELVTNGTFDTDITGWTQQAATVQWGIGGYLQLVGVASQPSARTAQASVLVIGATYTLVIENVGGGSVDYAVGASAGASNAATGTITSGTTLTRNFIANATTLHMQINSSASGTFIINIDNVSVKRVATVNNASARIINGTTTTRTAGSLQASRLFNRALTAAEVLDLSINGVALADRGASQTAVYTSNFSAGADGWTTTGSATVTGNIDGINGQDDWLRISAAGGVNTANVLKNLSPTVPAGKRCRIKLRVFLPADNVTLTGVDVSPRTAGGAGAGGAIAYYQIGAGNQLDIVYDSTTAFVDTFAQLRLLGINASNVATATAGDLYYVKLVEITQIGLTSELLASNAQSDTGQIFDTAGNRTHGLLPASGATVVGRPVSQTREVRWTNTWAGTNELQYIGGVNQAILPANAYIESIIGTVSGATPHDIIVGDGSDADRYVTITTGLAAGTTSFTLANRTTDGTNLKLTVDPDTNATMSIAWVISYRILE
jgi:hypothetical protein